MDDKKETELVYKVNNLEIKQEKMEKKQETTDEILHEIRTGIGAIKEALVSSQEKEDLKNKLLYKDIEGMKERLNKLESNQGWIVKAIIGEVVGLIFGIIAIFIQKGLG